VCKGLRCCRMKLYELLGLGGGEEEISKSIETLSHSNSSCVPLRITNKNISRVILIIVLH